MTKINWDVSTPSFSETIRNIESLFQSVKNQIHLLITSAPSSAEARELYKEFPASIDLIQWHSEQLLSRCDDYDKYLLQDLSKTLKRIDTLVKEYTDPYNPQYISTYIQKIEQLCDQVQSTLDNLNSKHTQHSTDKPIHENTTDHVISQFPELGTYIEEYLAKVKTDKSRKTHDSYAPILRSFSKFVGDIKLNELQPQYLKKSTQSI